jgi:hypothetical protein
MELFDLILTKCDADPGPNSSGVSLAVKVRFMFDEYRKYLLYFDVNSL